MARITACTLVFLLLSGLLRAQWDHRPQLYLEARACLVQDTASALSFDVNIAHHNEGPDTLYMFMEVADSAKGNLNLADSATPVIGIHPNSWNLSATPVFDLERSIPSYASNGYRMTHFHVMALPPGATRNLVLQFRVAAAGFFQPPTMRIRFIGTTYTHEFQQALSAGNWSVGPNPTRPHGRRLHAVDVTVLHRLGKVDSVEVQVVSEPLEEPYTYSQPLAYILRLLREWQGIGPWSVSQVGEVIVLRHRDMGRYYSALSPSRHDAPQSHWRPHPVEIGITLMRHIPHERWMRRFRNRPNVASRCQNLQEKAGEYKVSAFDTRLPRVQRKMQRHYRIFPTHCLDPKHDILVFTFGPSDWVALVEDDPVTRDYQALCKFIRHNFNMIWRRSEVHYLGNIGKRMLGIGLEGN